MGVGKHPESVNSDSDADWTGVRVGCEGCPEGAVLLGWNMYALGANYQELVEAGVPGKIEIHQDHNDGASIVRMNVKGSVDCGKDGACPFADSEKITVAINGVRACLQQSGLVAEGPAGKLGS